MMADTSWKLIEIAPTDRPIYACDVIRHYEGIVRKVGAEWEAINFEGSGTGTGFYPTHWRELPRRPYSKA